MLLLSGHSDCFGEVEEGTLVMGLPVWTEDAGSLEPGQHAYWQLVTAAPADQIQVKTDWDLVVIGSIRVWFDSMMLKSLSYKEPPCPVQDYLHAQELLTLPKETPERIRRNKVDCTFFSCTR